MTDANSPADLADLARLKQAHDALRFELGKVLVGQSDVIEQLLIGIFARGHVILEGVPGLAKTLMVSTLAECLSLDFKRIQFTPDLMPSDITGTEVLHEDRSAGSRALRFVPGPIFANVVLADEINRTPPKTQAALLEAMQERQVSTGGVRHPLPDPFFVLATQNPIEQEGTYPLPEAQLDRFLFKIFVGYPSADEERDIYRRTTGVAAEKPQKVLGGDEIRRLQELVRRVPISDLCIDYAMNIVRSTRREGGGPAYISRYVAWGAGPRAGQAMILGAKARAALQGRPEVRIEDIKAVAQPVMRHRIVTNYTAQAEGQSVDAIVARLLADAPENAGAVDGRVAKVFQS
ncbi:MAG TPA: MoxR family ATPase [Planctomycetia bacterium]|nr:MoxR family ATPase [Planctomycetia bacterium]